MIKSKVKWKIEVLNTQTSLKKFLSYIEIKLDEYLKNKKWDYYKNMDKIHPIDGFIIKWIKKIVLKIRKTTKSTNSNKSPWKSWNISKNDFCQKMHIEDFGTYQNVN